MPDIGQPWHAQAIAPYGTYGDLMLCVVTDNNAWWNYLNAHLAAKPGATAYADAGLGLAIAGLVGGSAVFNGAWLRWDGGNLNAIVFAWDAAALDLAVTNAQARGINVVRTVRVQDNVETDC